MKELTRRDQLEGRRIARVKLERGTSHGTGERYAHLRSIEFTDGSMLMLEVHETCEPGNDYAITGRLYPPETKTPRGLDTRATAEESPAGRPLRTSAPSCPDCDGPLNMGVTVGQPVAYECPRCEVRRTGPFLKQQARKAAR